MALLLAAQEAHADPLADLAKAHSAYVAHKYDDAESRLRALLDAKPGQLDPDNVADARMYLGAVLVEQRRRDEADLVFEKLLLDKPLYTPDPLLVSSEAINAFEDTKARLNERLRQIQDQQAEEERKKKADVALESQRAAQRQAMLEKQASEVPVVERNSRWRALVPFGVGQFQNGQNELGWAFLSVEGLLAASSAVGAVVSVYEQGQANDVLSRDVRAAEAYHLNASRAFVAADLLAAGFYLAAVIGAVQAEVKFVPERRLEVRKRPLPGASLTPSIGPGGAGLAGTF